MAESEFEYSEHPHRRYNPLRGEWILCSPHRAKRPWQGATEEIPPDTRPEYDPNDYLGPGNFRSGGKAQNPNYADTFVFDNDFMALLPDTPDGSVGEYVPCSPSSSSSTSVFLEDGLSCCYFHQNRQGRSFCCQGRQGAMQSSLFFSQAKLDDSGDGKGRRCQSCSCMD
mmetsp:Transcript_5431/g.23106  ORF Transcript_5431/g.23106 Transcript_5431/m.23106 type:complete len:169 (-) Transcript_5431:962-1468(-)